MPESDCLDILVSVEERHALGMLDGSKRVELRRRAPKVSGAGRMWIYSKMPVAAVTAVAELDSIEILEPTKLWKKYEAALALTHDEFADYVSGKDQVAAIVLGGVRSVEPVTLSEMRDLLPGFHPPQFYLTIPSKSKLLRRLEVRSRSR